VTARRVGPAVTNVPNGWGLDPETIALVNAMATQPTSAMVNAMETLILSLQDSGWWDEIGYMLVPVLHTEQASLLDWKNPTQTAVNNGAAFTAFQGFTGNGTSAFLATNLLPGDIPGYDLDSATVSLWAEDGTTTTVCLGGNSLNLNPFSGTVGRVRLNAAADASATWANRDGLSTIRRTGAATVAAYRSGVLTDAAIAQVSTAVPSGLCRILNNGGANFQDDRVLFAALGSGGVADPADLQTALDVFFDALGTVHT
jgi:hypothetical protein